MDPLLVRFEFLGIEMSKCATLISDLPLLQVFYSDLVSKYSYFPTRVEEFGLAKLK